MMINIFLSFVEISISISLIIVLLLFLSPFLNKRYAAKWKYWIWIVLALRLIIPLGGNGGQPVADIQSQGEKLTLSEDIKNAPDVPAGGAALGRIIVEIPAQMVAPIMVQSEKADSNISLLDIISFVWVSGSLLFASVHLISYFHYKRRILKKGRVVKDREVLCLLFRLKRELHIKCTVPVMEYREAASPLLIGFFKPVLVFPEEQYNMGEGYSREELFFILKHELIHLKRGDVYFKLLFAAANAIHWFNPLIWIMQKEAAVDMELSCDERVTKGTDYATRKAYTETLLSTLHKQKTKRTVLSTGFYGGKQVMKKRFKNILVKTVKKNGAFVLICAIMLTVCLGTLVGCSVAKENTEDGAKPLGAGDMQTDAISPEAGSGSDETEPSISDYPAETTPPSSIDAETQTAPPPSTDTEVPTPPPSSAEGGMQEAETDDSDLIFDNPVYLEDYYNTPDGRAAIEADFADLAGEGMSVTISVIMDEMVVTVKYEDSSLLTEGIEETLAQRLDSMSDRFWRQTIAYDENITWRCVLTVRYTDSEGNVLAEQGYSAE